MPQRQLHQRANVQRLCQVHDRHCLPACEQQLVEQVPTDSCHVDEVQPGAMLQQRKLMVSLQAGVHEIQSAGSGRRAGVTGSN